MPRWAHIVRTCVSGVDAGAGLARPGLAAGSWAVARAADTGATGVVVSDREWRRGMSDSALTWHTVEPASGTDATTVTISLT